MKTLRNITIALIILVFVAIISLCVVYNVNIKAVDKDDHNQIEIVIPMGTSQKNVGKILKDNNLIRSDTFFEIYIKLFKVKEFKASTYKLSRDMDLKSIIKVLEEGNSYNDNQIVITFKEGINIRALATLIATNTNNSYDDVINTLKDDKFLDELIENYWFITDDVKNDKLYYSLEGYLFPDTYYFNGKDVSVKEILIKMLNQMEKVLNNYKDKIEESSLTVHEILTFASIVEKEGKSKDFTKIASVFYNRLGMDMAFESCATAYYGMGMDFNEVGIATSEMMQNENSYNTYKVKFPVGPIAIPGDEAIKATLFPEDTNYLFFLSDNEQNSYFYETASEQSAGKQKLINEGKWYR